MRGKINSLGGEMNEWEIEEELAEFMAHCCAEKKNRESTVAGKLVAVNVDHEQGGAFSSPLHHSRIKVVEKGIKKAHVEAGNQRRVRRALT